MATEMTTPTSIIADLPEEPYFSRYGSRYTREQVVAALMDYEAMEAEWEAMLLAVEAAFDAADPGWNAFPGSMKYCKVEWMLALHDRLFSLQGIEQGIAYLPFAINRGALLRRGNRRMTTEMYPINDWARGIRKTRRQIVSILAQLPQSS